MKSRRFRSTKSNRSPSRSLQSPLTHIEPSHTYPTLPQLPSHFPPHPSDAPQRGLVPHLGVHTLHAAHWSVPPHPSGCGPHDVPHDVRGVHTHWFEPLHVEFAPHVPQLNVPPQPSAIVPQVAPAEAHVFGVHPGWSQAAMQLWYWLTQLDLSIGGAHCSQSWQAASHPALLLASTHSIDVSLHTCPVPHAAH